MRIVTCDAQNDKPRNVTIPPHSRCVAYIDKIELRTSKRPSSDLANRLSASCGSPHRDTKGYSCREVPLEQRQSQWASKHKWRLSIFQPTSTAMRLMHEHVRKVGGSVVRMELALEFITGTRQQAEDLTRWLAERMVLTHRGSSDNGPQVRTLEARPDRRGEWKPETVYAAPRSSRTNLVHYAARSKVTGEWAARVEVRLYRSASIKAAGLDDLEVLATYGAADIWHKWLQGRIVFEEYDVARVAKALLGIGRSRKAPPQSTSGGYEHLTVVDRMVAWIRRASRVVSGGDASAQGIRDALHGVERFRPSQQRKRIDVELAIESVDGARNDATFPPMTKPTVTHHRP